MHREVESEILDELSGDDPRAIRSRRDLRMINFLMGNERWIRRQEFEGGIVELGAGSGDLTIKLREKGKVIGLDLQTAPPGLEDEWISGDLFETLGEAEGNTVVANLILHHFQDDALRELGELLRKR